MKVQNPAVRTESYELYRMYGRACAQRLIQVTDSDVGNPIGLQSHPDTNHVTCLWGGAISHNAMVSSAVALDTV